MDVMLSNLEKKATVPKDAPAISGKGMALDLSKLDVCFGGFTPMALSDGIASVSQVELAQQRMADRRAQLEEAERLKDSIASEQRTFESDDGTIWTYVLLGNKAVRIDDCSTQSKSLIIPETIEGLPVTSLNADSCSQLHSVESIVCADSIIDLQPAAFRLNGNLLYIKFPKRIATFDSHWIKGCKKLRHMVLPGMLEKVGSSIFDMSDLEILEIGAGLMDVEPGAFTKSKLRKVIVSPDNPFLETDGVAIYTLGKKAMIALACPCEEYRISPGCQILSKKCFSSMACVHRIHFPSTLRVIGQFACAFTSIEIFDAPSDLQEICQKAFYNCESLRTVGLNEGLRIIGQDAFTGTSISSLAIPSTIDELGKPLANGTNIVFSGPNSTITLEKSVNGYFLDGKGGLYQRLSAHHAPERESASTTVSQERTEDVDGFALIGLIDPNVEEYKVMEGTKLIAEGALLKHPKISKMELPEGLEEIDRFAFKGSTGLKEVSLPSSLRKIGKEAFLDTSIQEVVLSPALEEIGENALVTDGAHHGKGEPSIGHIGLTGQSERFRVEDGLLMELKPNGMYKVLACENGIKRIEIPDYVDEVASYAFNGISDVQYLELGTNIAYVGIRGMAIEGLIGKVKINLQDPIEGHESFEFCFPDTDRSSQQLMLALNTMRNVDPQSFFNHYDSSIVNASSFDGNSERGLPLYDQTVRLLDRLEDPVLMLDVQHDMAIRVLRNNVIEACKEIALRDDREAIDKLLEQGFLNEGNLLQAIDAVESVRDASITSYLLEIRRRKFGEESIDFDL